MENGLKDVVYEEVFAVSKVGRTALTAMEEKSSLHKMVAYQIRNYIDGNYKQTPAERLDLYDIFMNRDQVYDYCVSRLSPCEEG